MTEALGIEERFPDLPDDGRKLLQWMQEHPRAPKYNHRCGDRMDAAARARVRAFEEELNAEPPQWRENEMPSWLDDFVERCFRDVPLYRAHGEKPATFAEIPTVSRASLSRVPWAFVPDGEPLTDLIVYNTSGTTGDRLDIPSHPETVTRYVPLLRAALGSRGVKLKGGAGRVGVMTVCFQQFTFTFASLSSYLDYAGLMKVNLSPAEWKQPEDIVAFLDECNPEIYTGDPLAFAELAKLALKSKPSALVSTAMAMSPALARNLEERFECPVFNLYSMNEVGPIAIERAETPGEFSLLQHRLYVEVVDEWGRPCAPGQRGEITVSGGFNRYVPLLRYRTGDFAALEYRNRTPLLKNLEGRSPVVFFGQQNQRINNIDVTLQLWPLAIPQFRLHQNIDRSLKLSVRGGADAEKIREILEKLFGSGQPLEIERIAEDSVPAGKLMQYTTDLEGA